jgi:hypothetical protein
VPPVAQPPASGASHGRTNVQWSAVLQVAPMLRHLQSLSTVHQPSLPAAYDPAGRHFIGLVVLFQSQMSPPHCGVATHWMSLVQLAGLVWADAVPAANRQTSPLSKSVHFVRFGSRVMRSSV